MAKVKYDAVIQAVHYTPDGLVDWVRVFQRNGPVWTDFVLLNRQELIDALKSGKIFMAGKRVQYMAGTFEVTEPIQLKENGTEILVVGSGEGKGDSLKGVPTI